MKASKAFIAIGVRRAVVGSVRWALIGSSISASALRHLFRASLTEHFCSISTLAPRARLRPRSGESNKSISKPAFACLA